MTRVFIDGSAGTTGLRILDRLSARDGIELVSLTEENRKDPAARKAAINEADVVFLCLPDDAARESAAMCENDRTVIIDASTAHRTADGWVYGFPELYDDVSVVRDSKRIAVPGCHASGFIALVRPLVRAGIISPEAHLFCYSVSGYSGAGKKTIAVYESEDRDPLLDAPRQYALGQSHKHLPEMKAVCALAENPVFCPIVDDYYKGMATTISLHVSKLNGVSGLRDVWKALRDYYKDQKLVKVYYDPTPEEGYEPFDHTTKLYANQWAGRDDLMIFVTGNDEQCTITALFDNLGKGASGAAVENMNIMLGFDPAKGLSL